MTIENKNFKKIILHHYPSSPMQLDAKKKRKEKKRKEKKRKKTRISTGESFYIIPISNADKIFKNNFYDDNL
jgi:hypothetical protein